MRDPGIRKTSLAVPVLAAATPTTLYIVSAGGTAPRTAILRKIWAYSNVGNSVLQIGTGLAGLWVALMPPMLVVTAMENIWEEEQLPCVEVGVNITMQASVLGIIVQIEVEEMGA